MALTQFTDADYRTILATLAETARGRWFLSEYAKRSRHTEIEIILAEINKLKCKSDNLFNFKTLSATAGQAPRQTR
jgi:hypothetical protein